jgi:hypothetical protein
MKNWIKVSLLVAGIGAVGATVYYFVKGSPGNELLAYVPNNSGLLVKFNLPEIGEALKGHEEEIKKFTFLKDKDVRKSDALTKTVINILKDPKKSGLDFSVPAMLFSEGRPRGSVIGFVVKLENADMFGEYIKKNVPAGNESGKGNDVEYAEFDVGLYVSWNQNVALVTEQKAENKSYFEDILNKRNPGAKGNLLLSKIGEQSGMMSAIFRIDELVSSHELKTRIPAAINSIKSPFPAGTAIIANTVWNNGEIRTIAHLASLNEDKIKDIRIFKNAGTLSVHEKALFVGDVPLAVLSLSLDMKSFFTFLENASPDFKEFRKSQEKFHEVENMFSGDVVFGVAMDEGQLNAQDEFGGATVVPKVKMLGYIGTKGDFAAFLQKNAPHVQPDADGIYLRDNPYSQAGFILMDNMVVMSNDFEELLKIKNKTYTPPTTKYNYHAEKNAPFYFDVNMEGMLNMYEQQGKTSNSFDHFQELFANNQVCYVKDGTLTYLLEMKDKKVHPLMGIMRFMEREYKNKEKEKQALEKELEMSVDEAAEDEI